MGGDLPDGRRRRLKRYLSGHPRRRQNVDGNE
jgi:hypothetical protein